MTVTVIGCDGTALTPAASAALAGASVVAGARRHLAGVTVPPAAERIVIQHLDTALDAICAARAPAAVLASGDPGFFGIVRALRARGVTPVVIPAVSSVALAFARLGLDWADALVLSAHGRAAGPVLAAALAHPKAAILTGPPEAATGQLRSGLLAAGRTVYAAECLGTPAERVRNLARHSAPEVADPHVLISLAAVPESASAVPESASAVRESASAVRESASAVRESASAVRESASAVRESASAVRESASAVPEPRLRFRSPCLRFRGPRLRFRSPRLRFGSPRLRFRSPRLRFRSPRLRFRSPRLRSRSPRLRFRSPRLPSRRPPLAPLTPRQPPLPSLSSVPRSGWPGIRVPQQAGRCRKRTSSTAIP